MAMKNKYAKRARISEAKNPRDRALRRGRSHGAAGGGAEWAEPQHREPALPGRAGAHAAGLRSPAPAVWGRRGRRELLRGAPGQGPAGARRLRQDRRLRHLRAAGPRLYRDRPGLLKAHPPGHHPRSGRPAHRHQLRWLARLPRLGRPRLWPRPRRPCPPTLRCVGPRR